LALLFVPTVEKPIRRGIDQLQRPPRLRPDDTPHSVGAMPTQPPCRPAQRQRFAADAANEWIPGSSGLAALDNVLAGSHNDADLDVAPAGRIGRPAVGIPIPSDWKEKSMKRSGSSPGLPGVVRKGVAVGLVCATFSAQALTTIVFSGSGFVTGPQPTSPVLTGLQVFPASTAYAFGGEAGWSLGSLFSFDTVALTGQGSGTLAKGADSLTFTFTSTAPSLGAPLSLTYAFTGGTGAYAGLVGSGASQVYLLGDPLGLPTAIPFIEAGGSATLAPVPEPETWALLAAGLLGLIGYKKVRPQHPA
jgi:hypothetical protein